MDPVLIDIHCHTREKSFDGRHSAIELLRGLVAKGFRGALLTDHNHTWQPDELDDLRTCAELPADFLLLAGQELRVAFDGKRGDLLLFGPHRDLPDGLDASIMLELAEDHDGFCIAPHPGAPGSGLGDAIRELQPLAAETWNGRYGARIASISERLALAAALPQVGGSDAHSPEDVGGGGTLFEEMPRSLGEMRELIAAGRAEPWRPPAVKRFARWLSGSGE